NGKTLRTFSIQPYPTGLAVDERLGYVFVASSGFGDHGGRIYVLDARSGRVVRILDVPKGNMAVAVDSRVHRVIVATHVLHGPIESTRLEVRDARSGRLLHTAIIAGSPAWRAMAVDEGPARAFVLTVNRGLSNAG